MSFNYLSTTVVLCCCDKYRLILNCGFVSPKLVQMHAVLVDTHKIHVFDRRFSSLNFNFLYFQSILNSGSINFSISSKAYRACCCARFIMATMRQSRPPARFSDPVHVVLPRRNVILRPFEGQPPKYARPRRLPELAVKKSRVPGAGFGLFLHENVRKGQTLTLYSRKIISEATAKKLKKQV